MSAHVSVFELKRFVEQRMAADELPEFEEHVGACAVCAQKLQRAAGRELGVRGLAVELERSQPAPALAALVALAASVLVVLMIGRGPLQLPTPPVENFTAEVHGSAPVISAPADGGMGAVAFFDGGGVR